jgi:DNA-binding MarR family transcriptional regulator
MELNEKVMIFIVLASETFKKKSSAILKDYGLTFPQYSVLRHLVSIGSGQDTVGNVGKKLMVSAANITGIARRLENAGLIEKKNDAQDDRFVMLQITRKGRQKLDAIREIQKRHGDAYLEIYSRERKEDVLSVLRNIINQGKRAQVRQNEQ